jgi:hypothetical protein
MKLAEMKLRSGILGLGLALLLGAPSVADAQCAMCAQGASQASQRSQKGITHGVIFLLVPPVGIMGAFIGLAVRAARKEDQAESLLE